MAFQFYFSNTIHTCHSISVAVGEYCITKHHTVNTMNKQNWWYNYLVHVTCVPSLPLQSPFSSLHTPASLISVSYTHRLAVVRNFQRMLLLPFALAWLFPSQPSLPCPVKKRKSYYNMHFGYRIINMILYEVYDFTWTDTQISSWVKHNRRCLYCPRYLLS